MLVNISCKSIQSRLKCPQDSFESKKSNPTVEMGSTSYIIPLRSESDEEYDPGPHTQPEPIAFRNKVAPSSPTKVQTEPTQSLQSRSPLFRAKSREYDGNDPPEIGTIPVGTTAANTTDMFIHSESGMAKLKRSIFSSNKSNSAGGSGSGTARPSKPNRSTSSSKSLNKSKRFKKFTQNGKSAE